MIKIELDNRSALKGDFESEILSLVKDRITPLKIVLEQLLGASVDVNQTEFKRFKYVASKLVNLNYSVDKKLFNKKHYQSTLEDYINKGYPRLDNALINYRGILEFLEDLLDNNCEKLRELLTYDGADLLTKYSQIQESNGISDRIEQSVLKLAFNYDDFSEISDGLKRFFRTRNVINFCPYCNMEEVRHIPNDHGGVAKSHQLDHFYDKATYPLFSYSLFNLVTSDSNCNTYNKSTTAFTEKFHINPYFEGFSNNAFFTPVYNGFRVKTIDITIDENASNEVKNKLLGSTQKFDETSEEGNINVFALKSRYKGRADKAEWVLNQVDRQAKGKKFINRLLGRMGKLNNASDYKAWYYENIGTKFDKIEHGEFGYSKFNRDIHDSYYRINETASSTFIKDLITNY